MKASKAFWVALVVAIGGCTQILELDQEYRPDGAGGNGGAGGGGNAGAGGAPQCMVATDCPPVSNATCASVACVDNICVTTNAPAGTSCGGGEIVCDGNGICGECNLASDCTMLPPDDECQARLCDKNVCKQKFTASGAKLNMQVAGDCQDAVCDGQGQAITKANNNDKPDDNNPCTSDVCTNGTPSNPAEPENTPCGTNLICNATGQCVGCLTANDCPGADDFCKKRTCVNQMCGFDFTTAGTNAPSGQTAGDCKVIECDGQGNFVTNPNDSDTSSDGNPCTNDTCVAGVPTYPAEPAGTSCPNGTCNGAGTCQKTNGSTCSAAGQCQSGFCTDGYCCDTACGQACKSCGLAGSVGVCSTVPAGFTDDACAAPKSCDGTSQGNASCVNKSANGMMCSTSTDCSSGFCVDGRCCNTSCTGICQACSAALKGAGADGTCGPINAGTDPSNECAAQSASTCGTTGTCNGSGACQLHPAGTTCVAQSCTGSTQFNTDSCNGTGMCVDAGTKNCAPYTCGATACKTSCAADADCVSTHYCSANVCVVKLGNGNGCTASNQCSSGFCADGVCCNAACTAACQACNMAGSVGTCSNVPLGQEDPGTCSGVNSCNGAGACLLDAGQPCTLNTECVSNNCTANVCQP